MPVDRSKYPPDWPIIAELVRMRDGDRCQDCGVENFTPIIRLPDGSRIEPDGKKYSDKGEPLGVATEEDKRSGKHVDIRCAVAHLHDPDPMNCSMDNLEVKCQQCHNRFDMPMRAKNMSVTKRAKRKKG